MKAKGLMNEFFGEVFGTFVLILLGDGVVANVGLAPRLAAPAYNWNTIVLGWCFAVIVAVYISGGVSGAHLNPAVLLASQQAVVSHGRRLYPISSHNLLVLS